MQTEPPIDPIPVGPSGWPPMVERLEFSRGVPLSEAAYWLAKASREKRQGMVAKVDGDDVYAWPHQSVDEVIRTAIRIAEVEGPPGTRWIAQRKTWLVERVRKGMIWQASAMARLGITDEEWASWEALHASRAAAGVPTRPNGIAA